MRESRARRRYLFISATLAATLLLSGCGGSSVIGAEGTESLPQSEEATVAQGSTDTTPVTPSGPAGSTGADAPGAVTGTTPDQLAGSGPAKPGAPKGTGGTGKGATSNGGGAAIGAGGLTGAVQNLVASHPIFGGTGACKPATLSEIPFGNVSTLSGVLGELFAPAQAALETFVAAQNACGGLNGHSIKLYFEDDQGDPSTAFTKGMSLVQKQKILAFVGNIQVLTVDAFAPVVKKTGIPVIGNDLTSNTWFTNPLIFPQGSSVQSMGYALLLAAKEYHQKKVIGHLYCLEVPRACEQLNRAMVELAPSVGVEMRKAMQISITAPSYVQQCLELKNAGVEVLSMAVDAASQKRVARSCEQVGFFPETISYPISVGNEQQFFGNKWLGNTYIPMNVFPWQGNTTPAEKYYQAAVKKYNPGFPSGGAASLGWSAGALLVAAGAALPATNPTTQNLLDALYTFQGQKFTELGGLGGPKTYRAGANPKVPYCYFAAASNDENNGWKSVVSKPTCSKVVAPSDPLAQG